MSIKERKEITKMLVKVEVAILMMIFTIILLHTMPLAGTAMFVVDCISINYHATMLDICNVANQLGILKDEKAEEVMKKHTFKCFDAMEHMGLDPYGAMKEES